ncbi:hypothetical protein [Gilliamella sp. B2838]|uniref:hypothetical protein n=1 Tax=Gilliamella sp. B2838 TaxID=2818020 RepID=UPI00226A0002|nr:hypothetical protein [Gilliamella sp. B2838]MCX8726352.1 hypothetical protein [Gilliamella sp. B2838]
MLKYGLNRASGIGHRASGIGHRASGIGHRASGIGQLIYCLFNYQAHYCYFSLSSSSPQNGFIGDVVDKTYLKFILLFFLVNLLLLSKVNALNVQTVNIIHGNAPQVIKEQVAADRLGFTVADQFYSESSGNINGNVVKGFDGNLKISDFKVDVNNPSVVDTVTNYNDEDGDHADSQDPFIVETTNYWWYDANNVELASNGHLTAGTQDKPIGCGSGYPMPLTLVFAKKVKARSQYGIPRESDYVTFSKKYLITATGLCYARPNSTEIFPDKQWLSFDDSNKFIGWNDKNNTTRRVLVGGGYTSDYVPDWGFKVNPTQSNNKKFPTTGFPGAKFQLIVAGAQSDYLFSVPVNPNGQVSVDSKGYVTIHDRPSGAVTVRATLKRDQKVMFDYTFNPTIVWAKPVKGFLGFWSDAIKICQGDHLLLHTQLSNAPITNGVNKYFEINNGFTRAIDSTLFSEWGHTLKHAYPDSDWEDRDDERYWSRQSNHSFDVDPMYNHLDVNAGSGNIGTDCESDSMCPDFLVCL